MYCCKIARIFLFIILIIGCTRTQPVVYADPPLFFAAPWLLRYTDTVVPISNTSYQVVRIPASGCELTDTIRLLSNEKYVVSGACGPPVNGTWGTVPDSTFFFGLLTDSGGGASGIVLLTRDSMTLVQRSSFRNPDSFFVNFVTMRYSH